MNSNSSNLISCTSSSSSSTVDSHESQRATPASILLDITARLALKELKASVFLNKFIEIRVQYFHRVYTLKELDIESNYINPN